MPLYRATMVLTYPRPGSPGANVWHFRTAGTTPSDAPARNEAVAAIESFYTDIIGSGSEFFAPGLRGRMTQAIEVNTQEAFDVDAQFDADPEGPNLTPDVLALVVGWKTSSATRRGRGRTFLGPLETTVLDVDGTPTAGALSQVSTAAQNLVDASTAGGGWAVGIYGLQNAGGGSTAPHVLRDITGFKVRDQFAVLRSRRD